MNERPAVDARAARRTMDRGAAPTPARCRFSSGFALIALLVLCPNFVLAQCTAATPCAYVANGDDSTVSVINTNNSSIVATVNVFGCFNVVCSSNPGYVATTPDGARAWVTNAGANADTISVIDTSQNAVVSLVNAETAAQNPGCGTTSGCRFPLGIAINPLAIDSSNRIYAYVANRNSASISVIDATTGGAAESDPTNVNGQTIVATVPLPVVQTQAAVPYGVAVNPADGKHVYVTDIANNQIDVIDTGLALTSPNGAVVSTISLTFLLGSDGYMSTVPSQLAFDPTGAHLYVSGTIFAGSQFPESAIVVVDTATNTPSLMTGPTLPPNRNGNGGLAVTPDGIHLYQVVFSFIGSVVVWDPTASPVNQEVATIFVGNGPVGMAMTPDGTQVYVTNSGDGTVSIVSTALNAEVGTPISTESFPPSDSGPTGIAIQGGLTVQPAAGTAPLSGTPLSFAVGGLTTAAAATTWDFFGNGSVTQTAPTLSTQVTPYLAAGTFFAKVTVHSPTGSVLVTKSIPVHIDSPVQAFRTSTVLVKVLRSLSLTTQASLTSQLGTAYLYLQKGETSLALTELSTFYNHLNGLVSTGAVSAKAAAPALSEAQAIGLAIKKSVPNIGTGELTPNGGNSRVGDPVTFTATWTVPDGKSWRSLDHLDLRLVQSDKKADEDTTDPPIALWARFNIGTTSTFSLVDADGTVIGTGTPGSNGTIESDTATLDLARSSFQGTGPTGPSVTVKFAVRFKAPAAGADAAQVYRTDLLATDLLEQIQASDDSGHWTIRPVQP